MSCDNSKKGKNQMTNSMEIVYASNRWINLASDDLHVMVAIDLDGLGRVNVRVVSRGVYGYTFAETLCPDEHPEVNGELVDEFWNRDIDCTDTRLNVNACTVLAVNLIETIVEVTEVRDPGLFGMVWADFTPIGSRPGAA